MQIVRTGSYWKGVKRLFKLGASEQDIVAMEDAIAANPQIGEVMPGSGGMRKVRFGFADVGARGGGRTIYYVLTEDETLYLLVTYPKVDKNDLTKAELKLFKTLVKELTHG